MSEPIPSPNHDAVCCQCSTLARHPRPMMSSAPPGAGTLSQVLLRVGHPSVGFTGGATDAIVDGSISAAAISAKETLLFIVHLSVTSLFNARSAFAEGGLIPSSVNSTSDFMSERLWRDFPSMEISRIIESTCLPSGW